ncbi:MAG: c-type cytochrome domain-containing protein, partial [Bryobacteraceae bacterium]
MRAILWGAAMAGVVAADDAIFRERMAGLLEKHCASCHSGATPQSSLSVGSFDALLRGGKHGPAIVPGRAAQSLLVQHVRGEKTPRMPLGGELAEAGIAALVAAIDSMKPLAAKARDPHVEWLYSKPKTPAVPDVKRKELVANPIDAFLLAKLEAQG